MRKYGHVEKVVSCILQYTMYGISALPRTLPTYILWVVKYLRSLMNIHTQILPVKPYTVLYTMKKEVNLQIYCMPYMRSENAACEL